ncbi:MAG: DUF2281 domain-containing protein, partial [Bacteroidota bacterium]
TWEICLFMMYPDIMRIRIQSGGDEGNTTICKFVRNDKLRIMSHQQAIQLFYQMPLELQNEVVDFIEFLAKKRADKIEEEKPIKRQPGIRKDLIIYMAPDFDAPLEDFKDYM